MPLTEYQIHPAADLFPMMTAKEFSELKDDIKAHGVRELIVIFDGKLLDGRNRYKAMRELGIDPEDWASELEECDDPVSWVLSHNLHRRHLTQSQRSQIAADVATLRRGDAGNGRKVEGQICTSTIDDAAKALNVSPRSVKSAKKVKAGASQAVVDAVKNGVITVSLASKLVDAIPDKKEQSKLVEQGKKAVQAAVKKHADSKRKPKQSPPQEPQHEVDPAAIDEPEQHPLHTLIVLAQQHCKTLATVIERWPYLPSGFKTRIKNIATDFEE